jgi:hypothetical protein
VKPRPQERKDTMNTKINECDDEYDNSFERETL